MPLYAPSTFAFFARRSGLIGVPYVGISLNVAKLRVQALIVHT